MSKTKVLKETNSGEQKLRVSDDNHLPKFDRSLPMMLLRAREAVMAQFTPALKEHDLSAQQWRAIRTLDQNNGLEISELSKRCYLLKPSMSRILQNLEARKLIERRAVATDQRRSALYLTQAGRDIVNIIAPKSESSYRYITEQFGSEKLENLTELLDELMNAIDHSETTNKETPCSETEL